MMTKVRFTRQQRGQARRVANRMLTNEHREFESESTPGKVYTARIMQDGKAMCDCRGWTIRKRGQPRFCKHVEELLAGRPTRSDGEFHFLYTGAYTDKEGA